MKRLIYILFFIFTSSVYAGEVLYNPGPGISDWEPGNPTNYQWNQTVGEDPQIRHEVIGKSPDNWLITYNHVIENKDVYPGWAVWYQYDPEGLITTTRNFSKNLPYGLYEVTNFNYLGLECFEYRPDAEDTTFSFEAKIGYVDRVQLSTAQSHSGGFHTAVQFRTENDIDGKYKLYHIEVIVHNIGSGQDYYFDGSPTDEIYWSIDLINEGTGWVYDEDISEIHVIFVRGDAIGIPELTINWQTYGIDFLALAEEYFTNLPQNLKVNLFEAYSTARNFDIEVLTRNASVKDSE